MTSDATPTAQTQSIEEAIQINFKLNYNRIVNKCMNLYLTTNYQLRGYTQIVSCVSNKDAGDSENLEENSECHFDSIKINWKYQETRSYNFMSSQVLHDCPNGAEVVLLRIRYQIAATQMALKMVSPEPISEKRRLNFLFNWSSDSFFPFQL